MNIDRLQLEQTVAAALKEDIGRGDITTRSLVDPHALARAVIISRTDGVVAGLEAALIAFRLLDPDVETETVTQDGGRLEAGDTLVRINGRARAVLSAERVALNFLQHLSGVATATARAVAAVEPLPVAIVDTRKTTPGLRTLEKEAVRLGGGRNHRLGLDDAVLIKENHLEMAGGVARAVELARLNTGPLVKVEVEVETMDQAAEAVAAGADVIMLDNMAPDEMARAVEMINGRALVEASGNITPDNVRQVAESGVDFISLGWITHSAPPLDLSLGVAIR